MSVASEITRLQNAKANLKASINAKNDSQHQITDESIDEFMDFVGNIPSLDSLQSKSVTITENTTTNISADSGYSGLSSVSVTTNVSGGDIPEKGVVFTEWDSDGYPTKAIVTGITTIPVAYFSASSTTSTQVCSRLVEVTLPSTATTCYNSFSMLQRLKKINLDYIRTYNNNGAFQDCIELEDIGSLNNAVISLPSYCFSGCSKLKIDSLPPTFQVINNYTFAGCYALALESLPSSVYYLGSNCFQYCTSLKLTTLPDAITSIPQSAFLSSGIKKMSFDKVTTINGNSSTASFGNCTSLKQVWIGSSLTGLGRYAFKGCSSLNKIYINLPRATVETFAGYTYAFMNNTSKTDIIVCNDDSGFIDKATFDAQVIS